MNDITKTMLGFSVQLADEFKAEKEIAESRSEYLEQELRSRDHIIFNLIESKKELESFIREILIAQGQASTYGELGVSTKHILENFSGEIEYISEKIEWIEGEDELCRVCNGSGEHVVSPDMTCERCKGSGVNK